MLKLCKRTVFPKTEMRLLLGLLAVDKEHAIGTQELTAFCEEFKRKMEEVS